MSENELFDPSDPIHAAIEDVRIQMITAARTASNRLALSLPNDKHSQALMIGAMTASCCVVLAMVMENQNRRALSAMMDYLPTAFSQAESILSGPSAGRPH